MVENQQRPATDQMVDQLFVYGEFMRGFPLFQLLGAVGEPRAATTSGKLYHLPYRRPILLDGVAGTVTGEVVSLSEPREVLKQVDEIRGFTEYDPADLDDFRVIKTVRLEADGEEIQAYAYVFPRENHLFLRRVAQFIEGGDWRRYLAAREFAAL